MQQDNTNDTLLSTPRPPQRKSRVVISSIDSPASRTRAKTGSSSSDLVIRNGRVPLGQKSATIATRGLKSSSPLKPKSSALLVTDGGTPKRTRNTLRSTKETKSRKNGTSSSSSKEKSSSSSKRVKKAVMAQHASFVQAAAPSFTVLRDSDSALPNDQNLEMDYLIQGSLTPVESGDMEMNDASNVSAIVQRMVDQRCRELTVRPLANVSEAYGASSSVFGSSDMDGMY